MLIAGSAGLAQPGIPLGVWEAADRQTVRLSPSAFTELPKNLVAELHKRGCTIPQTPMVIGRQNVIQGDFARPGQIDWAVLCSVGRTSSVLVFWNGLETNPAEIAPRKDQNRLQSWTGDNIVYSGRIQPFGKDEILAYYKGSGGEKPPEMDHQGIDDIFYGKASEVLYFYRGKWLHLTGAD